MPNSASTVPQVSPEETRWNLSQLAASPGWVGEYEDDEVVVVVFRVVLVGVVGVGLFDGVVAVVGSDETVPITQ